MEPATASPPSADAAGGPYPPQPSAPTGAPPSAPAPAPLVKEEITTTSNPTPPGPRDTGALTLGKRHICPHGGLSHTNNTKDTVDFLMCGHLNG